MFSPGAVLQTTYDAFQELLAFDCSSHEMMAELETLYHQGIKEDFCKISLTYNALAENVRGMIESLDKMAPGSHPALPAYFRKFDFYSRFFLAPPALQLGEPFVLQLSDKALSTELAGSKTTKLVELSRIPDLSIPTGFVITTNSFSYLIEYNNLRPAINALLAEIDINHPDSLSQISARLIALLTGAEIPPDTKQAILSALKKTLQTPHTGQLFAVRSSAINEDGPCSFAGQYSSYLNVKPTQLLESYLKVISSKYSPEALAYRINCGLSDEETPMAVMVLEMVDAASAGVLYTTDPSGSEKNRLFIHATQGLGESVVSGTVLPDVFSVHKTNNQITDCSNAEKSSAEKKILSKIQILTLSAKGRAIEHHFENAQDIEWALKKDGSCIFLQSRDLQTYLPEKKQLSTTTFGSTKPLFRAGVMASFGIASGKAWCPAPEHPLEQIPKDTILVIHETLPSYVRILHQVSGVIAELGSAAGHFATVCREFGIPLLLGVGNHIHRIQHEQAITLSTDETAVYSGDTFISTAPTASFQRDQNLPFYQKLRSLLKFITPLKLIDPNSSDFTPESCRSLHDIIRFCHEEAMRTMFSLGDLGSGRTKGKKKLLSKLPLDVFLLDIGGGLQIEDTKSKGIHIDKIASLPFLALWHGLNHPSVEWQERTHFNWKSFDDIALAGGIASKTSAEFASFAVLGSNYVNLNIRFGYHFTLVDALCGNDSATNYCQLRFAGGGGDFAGRHLRIHFVEAILKANGFQVSPKGDLLDAILRHLDSEEMEKRLQMVGRLLGVTKLLDMRLKNETMVEELIKDFLSAQDVRVP